MNPHDRANLIASVVAHPISLAHNRGSATDAAARYRPHCSARIFTAPKRSRPAEEPAYRVTVQDSAPTTQGDGSGQCRWPRARNA